MRRRCVQITSRTRIRRRTPYRTHTLRRRCPAVNWRWSTVERGSTVIRRPRSSRSLACRPPPAARAARRRPPTLATCTAATRASVCAAAAATAATRCRTWVPWSWPGGHATWTRRPCSSSRPTVCASSTSSAKDHTARYVQRCPPTLKTWKSRGNLKVVEGKVRENVFCLCAVKGKERKSIYIAPFCTKVHTERSGMDHTVLPANNTMPAFPSWAFTRWHHHNNWGSRHPIAPDYPFIDPAWLVDL